MEIKKKYDCFTRCRTPELASEITVQPIRRYGMDAAILFSDILTIPDALGLGVNFVEGKGPVFQNPIKSSSDINNLITFDPNDLNYVYEAVSNIVNER